MLHSVGVNQIERMVRALLKPTFILSVSMWDILLFVLRHTPFVLWTVMCCLHMLAFD